MILDAFSNALQKDIEKITWLPAVIIIIKIIIYIAIIFIAIDHYISVIQTKKYTKKIYELLKNSPLNNDDNKKEK